MSDQRPIYARTLEPHVAIAVLYVIATLISFQVISNIVQADIKELTQRIVESCHVTITRQP